MSSAVSVAQPLVHELHATLLALDAARFRDAKRAELASRLQALRDRLSQAAASSELGDTARARFAEIAEHLRSQLPDVSEARERWMRFRDELQPRYEALLVALREHAVHAPSLRPTNYVRNVFHVGNALGVVALLVFLPSQWLIPLASAFFGLAVFLETSRRVSARWNDVLMKLFGPVAHPYEHYRVNSASWYVGALFVLAWMQRPMVAAVGVGVLGLADPAASIVGRRFGRHKLIHGRTLEGTTTFAIVGASVAAAVLIGFGTPIVTALVVALVSGVAGALAELLSRRIDDNFSVPVLTAAAAWGVLSLFG
jgi:dolichol kinase